MRFKLTLQINKNVFGNRLPLNYQYEQSALIYRILSRASQEFSLWLHENGFTLESGKQFKLFTFSRFSVPKYRILPDSAQMALESDTVTWFISFLPDISTEKFVQGLFQQQTFEIGDKKSVVQFYVRQIEVIPPPVFTDKMVYETLSPVCIPLKHQNGSVEYIDPNHSRAGELVMLNLLEKYRVVHKADFPVKDVPFAFTALNKPKSVLTTIKSGTPNQTQLRGFMFRFAFSAPIEQQQLLYETGCGSKNSLGFGMVKEIDVLHSKDEII